MSDRRRVRTLSDKRRLRNPGASEGISTLRDLNCIRDRPSFLMGAHDALRGDRAAGWLQGALGVRPLDLLRPQVPRCEGGRGRGRDSGSAEIPICLT